MDQAQESIAYLSINFAACSHSDVTAINLEIAVREKKRTL